MTVYENLKNRAGIIREAENRCLVRGKLGMALIWKEQRENLERKISGLDALTASAEYRAPAVGVYTMRRVRPLCGALVGTVRKYEALRDRLTT